MLPYTGGKPQPRFAILVSTIGGGGFEIWGPAAETQLAGLCPLLGDTGILICKVKCPDVQRLMIPISRGDLTCSTPL